MRIQCPNCETIFSVGENALGENGRKVRCSQCKHEWFQSPETALPEPAVTTEELAEAAAVETTAGQTREEPQMAEGMEESGAIPELDVDDKESVADGPRPVWRGLLVILVIMIAIAAAGFVLARNQIAEILPQSRTVYAALGFTDLATAPDKGEAPQQPATPANPAEGLSITHTNTKLEEVGGVRSLIISGTVTNTTSAARDIPPLQVTLADANNAPLNRVVIRAKEARLLAGAVTTFEAKINQPSDKAVNFEIDFVVPDQ